MARPDTRRAILEAALECFLIKGVAGTSIAEVKARAKVTTGSVYHFFEGKDDIAQALCAEALGSRARAVAALQSEASAEETVRSMVAALIGWAIENDALHRFLVQSEFLAPSLARRPELVDVLMSAKTSLDRVLRGLLDSGEVRSLPPDLLRSQILGPAEDYLRDVAYGRSAVFADEAARLLGEAAWIAVRSSQDATPKAPAGKRRAAREWDLV